MTRRDPTVAPGGRALVRRKRFWPPLLRPRAGRRLPPTLQPDAVHRAARTLPGGLGDPAFAELISRIDQGPFHGDTELEPFFAGAPAFDAMLAAVGQAQSEILLEAYIISGDATGRAFLDALAAAVRRGVAVYVLADAFGSSATHADFWKLLRSSGLQLRLFRRPRYAPRAWLPIFDHRKLLVVDREVGFTGGMNIADEYCRGSNGDPAWRDTHVRISGTLAWELALLFSESWAAAGGDPLRVAPRQATGDSGRRCLLLDSRPGRGSQEVHAAFAAIIGGARRRLWITNAYFAPQARILRWLIQAARAGTDVRLLTPQHSDIPLIRAATRGYYTQLLRSGVKVYEYQAAVLHAKTLVADDLLCVIGSTNFDLRSFAFNHECNVLALDRPLARQMQHQFEVDLTQSRPIVLDSWRRRPLWQRLFNWLARRLSPFL